MPVRRQLLRERLGEGEPGGAAHRGRQGARARGLGAGVQDVDDPAASRLPHGRHAEPHAADRREELQLEVGLPGRVVDRVEPSGRRGAGVVDEDVDPPEPPERRGHEPLEVAGARDVSRHVQDRRTLRPERPGRLREARRVAPADRDGRPLGGEPPCGGEPEPVAAAGDDRNLPLQSEIHRRLPRARPCLRAGGIDHPLARPVKTRGQRRSGWSATRPSTSSRVISRSAASPVSRVASEGSPRAPVRLQSGPDPGSASKTTGW